jgi:hypothetical protein
MERSWFGLKTVVLAACAAIGFGPGCSCDDQADNDGGGKGGSASTANANGGTGTGGTASTAQFMSSTGGSEPVCVNLECQQVACSGNTTTTVSGTVFDPSGTLPLYNVAVYVPNAPVGPIPDGLSCDTCDAQLSGSPLVSAITDTQGKFTLTNVPVGDNIPLVLQVGKWRRIISIPTVQQCVDNPLSDPNITRLPKNSTEGNIPRIALTTGGADPLFCLLRRLGLDDTEYGIAGSPARIHFYTGDNGATEYDPGFGASPGADFPNGPTTLWNDGWPNYDIVMLSCEGSERPAAKDGHRTALRDYINTGGRVFATHYHYNWFQGDAPADMQSVATFSGAGNNFDDVVNIDMTFPKGMALADWLFFVDGSSPLGTFDIVDGRNHAVTVSTMLARLWVSYMMRPIYFSFNAPIGAPEDMQCGRMVFSDIHVSAGAGGPNGAFPSTCNNNPLTEQEKVLLFMLFDLSSCIIPDDDPPCPPGQTSCGDANDPVCNGTCINQCCVTVPE